MPTNNSNKNRPTRRPTNTRKAPTRKTPTRARKKKADASTYLYVGVILGAIAMVLLFAIIICGLNGDNDRDRDRDREKDDSSFVISGDESTNSNSSYISDDSSESSDNSDTSDTSDTSSGTSSDDPNPPEKPVVNGSAEATQKYEEYIGIEYAIDMTEYEKYVCPKNESDFVFLVNPANPLGSDFVPKNLVWCTSIREGRPKEWSKMDATANYALEAFLAEAAYYGFDDITVTNAYRSYASQSSLFNGYIASDMENDFVCDECDKYIDISYYPKKVTAHCNDCGSVLIKSGSKYSCEICLTEVSSSNMYFACSDCGVTVRRPTRNETEAHVLTYSTRPGTSEHQSGLCCDMHNLPNTTSAFDNTPEAIWLAQNAHRFGFILRYPPNTQSVTGIKHESWHFRYVGRTAATEIYEMQEKLGLDRMYTLDEYVKNK